MGNREYGNKKDRHYIGPAHDAVPLRSDPNSPLEYGNPEIAAGKAEQQIEFDLIGRLSRLRGIEYPDDPALVARIKAYELAFRMQTSVPEVLSFADETEETKKLYGLDEDVTRPFGMQLLSSR